MLRCEACNLQSVKKVSVRVSQKMRHIVLKIIIFKKNEEQSVLKNMDFQRRYNAFSETSVQIFLLHSVCVV